MDYFRYDIKVKEGKNSEVILALLSQLPFDTFEENASGFAAYIPAKGADEQLEVSLNSYSQQFSFDWEKTFIPYQNWNALWESNFEPIRVGDFCGIRAHFHPPFQKVKHEIVIQPKMAFGTGHHATTYMMMQMMEKEIFRQKKVLDYGCGTGILAILAAFLGANTLDAVDIELAAYENTLENIRINQTPNIEVFHGTLDQIVAKDYDCILANINRNVILNSFPALYNKLVPGGSLLVSGFVLEDEKLLRSEALKNGFNVEQQLKRADWVCLRLTKQ